MSNEQQTKKPDRMALEKAVTSRMTREAEKRRQGQRRPKQGGGGLGSYYTQDVTNGAGGE